MQKLLTTLEEIKETQKTHSVMLQSIMRQINTPQLENDYELPNDIHFPLSNIKDINDLEEHLKDQSIKRTLVSILFSMFNNIIFHNFMVYFMFYEINK